MIFRYLLALMVLPLLALGDIPSFSGVSFTEDNEASLYYSSIPYAVARQGLRQAATNENVIGFSEFGTDVFAITQELRVIQVRKSDRELLSSWNLDSYNYHYFINSEQISISDESSDVDDGESVRLSEAESPIEEYEPSYLNLTFESGQLGCLSQTPLRVGDVEDDGVLELAIMFGSQVVIFSPENGVTSFSFHYWLDDELESSEADSWVNQFNFNVDYQYIASSSYDVLFNYPFRAWRSASKLFQGEFDGESGYDLVLWRKVFDTNLVGETDGFHKVADVLVHYYKVDGVYVIKETDEATIQSWLSDNDLTWSKGYPSVSECEGEEGELIPEMHDPLLNDPDVLE